MKARGRDLVREFTCMTAVRKDIGLKKPATQSDFSKERAVVHSMSWSTRATRSENHADKPLSDGYANFAQRGFTLFPCKFLLKSSMPSEMLRAPEIPSSSSVREFRIHWSSTFMRSDSCNET